MRNLSQLIDALPEQTFAEVTIDATALFPPDPSDPDPVLFIFREPDTAALFALPGDAFAIRKGPFLEFNEELCESIALLALCHVSPPYPIPRAQFYALLALHNRDVFLALAARLKAAFPATADFTAAVEEETKN